jgi:hypothetical protein
VYLTHAFNELFETYHILRAPLLITDAEELEVEGLGVTHLCANLTILCGDVAIRKFNEVDSVLDIGVKVVYGYVSVLAMVLILA